MVPLRRLFCNQSSSNIESSRAIDGGIKPTKLLLSKYLFKEIKFLENHIFNMSIKSYRYLKPSMCPIFCGIVPQNAFDDNDKPANDDIPPNESGICPNDE